MFIFIMVYVLAVPATAGPSTSKASCSAIYQRPTLRLLPAGATVAGWDTFLPLDQRALFTAHAKFRLVYCLVNRFRKWQDLWRPPKLCGFC